MEMRSCILIINIVVPFIFFPEIKAHMLSAERCDLFRGEWIQDSAGPPYDETCKFVDRRQNCLLNGRPDRGYLHWRWKPRGCDLPHLDPYKLLSTAAGKAVAFVGDSLSRNQKDSMMCLLSKVEMPTMVYADDSTGTGTWYFPSSNFTLAYVRSLFLLRSDTDTPLGPASWNNLTKLHLDILDGNWVDRYNEFDYVVLGVGAWFDHPTIWFEDGNVVGCHKCAIDGVRELGQNYLYRRAIELSFRFVAASDHKPSVIYRIHSGDHFEHGQWFEGGYCNRTEPFKEGEFADNMRNQELERVGREEFAKAVEGKEEVRNLEMLDVYHLSLLRPDGHPDGYRPRG